MTPDELPADMEGRLEKLASMTTVDPTPLDAYGRCSATFGDLRALLKAYQEQRRALERIVNAADAGITKRHIRDYAAEALNQKGDER
jgi:hypothetical protein